MQPDQQLFDIIEREQQRQRLGIELIASENFVSEQVMRAMGSWLSAPRPAALYSHSITSDIAQSYHSASSLSPSDEHIFLAHVPEMHKHQLLHVQHFCPRTFQAFPSVCYA